MSFTPHFRALSNGSIYFGFYFHDFTAKSGGNDARGFVTPCRSTVARSTGWDKRAVRPLFGSAKQYFSEGDFDPIFRDLRPRIF